MAGGNLTIYPAYMVYVPGIYSASGNILTSENMITEHFPGPVKRKSNIIQKFRINICIIYCLFVNEVPLHAMGRCERRVGVTLMDLFLLHSGKHLCT